MSMAEMSLLMVIFLPAGRRNMEALIVLDLIPVHKYVVILSYRGLTGLVC